MGRSLRAMTRLVLDDVFCSTKSYLVLMTMLMVLFGCELGQCQDRLRARDLRFGYNVGGWYAFGKMQLQHPVLENLSHTCGLAIIDTSRIGVIDSVRCNYLRSTYFLTVVVSRRDGNTDPFLFWTAVDQSHGGRFIQFGNADELVRYLKADFVPGSVSDSSSALDCAIAIATLASPVLPIFFPTAKGQLPCLYGAIWDRQLWEEVLVSDSMCELIGSAAISGSKLESICRVGGEFPYGGLEDEVADSLSSAVFSIRADDFTFTVSFMTWSPRRGTYLSWRVAITSSAIESISWNDLKLLTAGLECGSW